MKIDFMATKYTLELSVAADLYLGTVESEMGGCAKIMDEIVQ